MRFLSSLAPVAIAIGVLHPLIPTSFARSSVRSPTLADLVDASELIVLARVESIGPEPVRETGGYRGANAKVLEVWKGSKVDVVEYRVGPANFCDISRAERGETVLLFLTRERTGWGIAWVGRGRMPKKSMNGKDYLTAFSNLESTEGGHVQFPAGTPRIKAPKDNGYGYDVAVELDVVKRLVRTEVERKK